MRAFFFLVTVPLNYVTYSLKLLMIILSCSCENFRKPIVSMTSLHIKKKNL